MALRAHLSLLMMAMVGLAWAPNARAQEEGLPDDATPEDGDAIRDILISASVDDAVVVTEATAEHALLQVLRHGPAFERDVRSDIATLVSHHLQSARGDEWLSKVVERELVRAMQKNPKHEAQHVEVAAFDIPVRDHPLVDAYIDYFTGRGREHFTKWLGRLDRYKPLMEPILVANGVPKDLIHVALIESGMSAGAYSRAAACGYWQFIKSTGAMYGMRMDFWVDERRDFLTATAAASRYMRDLYREFGDWHLAWASYNAGSGRVNRALTRFNASDFWGLLEYDRSLAKETRHYVPKIIAAAIIAKDRARFGFTNVVSESPLVWDDVEVPDAVDLRAVAKVVHSSVEQLRELNPAYLHDVTPPGRRSKLRIPAGTTPIFVTWLESVPASERLTYQHYKVQKGDTLSTIAKRYGSTSNAISEFNRIRSAKALRIGMDLIIPTVRAANVRSMSAVSQATPNGPKAQVRPEPTAKSKHNPTVVASAKKPAAKKHHVVKRGESLWSIAQQYGVAMDDLKLRNGLRGTQVNAGAKLKIF